MKALRSSFLYSLAVWLALTGLALSVQTVRGDIGPKPTADFEFVFENGPDLTIMSGELLECDDPQCASSHPLEELGPQCFACSERTCESMAYGYAENLQLSILFSDGVIRQSNVFGKRYFSARYTVTVRADDLLVEEKMSLLPPVDPPVLLLGGILLAFLCGSGFLAAMAIVWILWIVNEGRGRTDFKQVPWLFITSWLVSLIGLAAAIFSPAAVLATDLIEIGLGLVFAQLRRLPKLRLATLVTLANTLTQVLLQAGMQSVEGGWYWLALGIAEIIVVIAEAGLYYLALRKTTRFTEMLLLSLLLNLASLAVGMGLAF